MKESTPKSFYSAYFAFRENVTTNKLRRENFNHFFC